MKIRELAGGQIVRLPDGRLCALLAVSKTEIWGAFADGVFRNGAALGVTHETEVEQILNGADLLIDWLKENDPQP